MHSSHVAEVAFWIAWVVFSAWIAPPLIMERIFLGANHVHDICRCLLINKVASLKITGSRFLRASSVSTCRQSSVAERDSQIRIEGRTPS